MTIRPISPESTYPTDPENTLNYVPASSQTAVDALAAVVGGIKQTRDTIQTNVNTITQKLRALIGALGTAQGTTDTINATATDIQQRTDKLQDGIGTLQDIGTTTANGLAHTINDKLGDTGTPGTVLGIINSFQALTVRMEIESALSTLADPYDKRVAMF